MSGNELGAGGARGRVGRRSLRMAQDRASQSHLSQV